MKSFYEKVFEFARMDLGEIYEERGGMLEKTDIPSAVQKVREIINSPLKERIFRCSGDFTEEDYKRLEKDLEKHFDVKMDLGSVIQGKEQQERDTEWYRKSLKGNPDRFYWNRLRKFLGEKKGFPLEVIRAVGEDTDLILNQLGNPKQEERFSIFGMVVGHVQSGKTTSYGSLITKAVDAGYKFIVIIAGNTNILRNQTQMRINEMFVGKNDRGEDVGVGLIAPSREKQPISLTTEKDDFKQKDAQKNSQGLNLENTSTSFLLVIKKNTTTISSVIKWLKSSYKNSIAKHAMLLIDDESDWGSINTKTDEDPTTINKKIRDLLKLFEKSTYVAYTATPFANIFIDHRVEGDLFPNDFIYALDAPNNYCGAQEIFIEHPEQYLVDIQDHGEAFPLKHKKEHKVVALPKSLLEAIHVFCINIALRHLSGYENKCNSMLVNVSRFTDMHKRIDALIADHIDRLKQDILAYAKLQNPEKQSVLIAAMQEVFSQIKKYNPKIKHSWQEVLEKLSYTISEGSGLIVKAIHQATKDPINYKEDKNIIAVGGLSLARGFTLEDLSVSYFVRNSIYYDTLMQMGRWFGYREGYKDLCKIYMPKETRENFAFIAECMDELMEKFREMSQDGSTPLDFGLAVRQDPNNILQITAKNKMKKVKSITLDLDLNGVSREQADFSHQPQEHEDNFKCLLDLIRSISPLRTERHGKDQAVLYKGVDQQHILEFVNCFKMPHKSVYGENMWQLIEPIKRYLEEKDQVWDVILYGGRGTPIEELKGFINIQAGERKVADQNNCLHLQKSGRRKLISKDPEEILLGKEKYNALKEQAQIESTGRRTHYLSLRAELENPVLMLSIATLYEGQDGSKKNPFGDKEVLVPAYGVCFPYRGVKDQSQVVKVALNTVAQELREEETQGDDDE
ncbi:Z1 domain-containing protein [Helicobacter ailurogastricus]|uniref:Z1 domain-containing protein n=1 Tax=Helicobacter ailurogastricus TaxID=1578720 RepID=UPI0022C78DD6|nr:Z1 domain-containing protein [Helicobacter ailurogastricus]GLH58239.1 endonuclease [Helicobacter ailurogastricus]GLH59111.1 endonuclease [Helicobacter ailurogastricus]